jgi:predicted MFS family arabinose efflux permease
MAILWRRHFYTLFKPIPRIPDVSRRAVLLALGGRFADEVLSGLFDVLMPTFRARLGLSYTQVSLLPLALNYTAVIVEPAAGLLIDLWSRRWLMVWGAFFTGLSILLMGLAPTFLLLLVAFACYGLGSGPLAHTADVVLVEAHPQAPDRIVTRATVLDTIGALLAPLLVAASFWGGLSWRWPLLIGGTFGLIYSLALVRANFPPPSRARSEEGAWREIRANLQTALRDRTMWRWLLFLLAFDLFEAPLAFETIWLHEQVGMSQALVGVYRALAMGVNLASLLVLDHWLARWSSRSVLLLASAGLLLLIPLWLLLPGVWTRFLLALPLNFLFAVFWPIGRAQSLAAVPGRAGTVTAINATFALLPLTLLFGLLAEAVTLTRAMLLVQLPALLLLGLLVWKMPESTNDGGDQPPVDRSQS